MIPCPCYCHIDENATHPLPCCRKTELPDAAEEYFQLLAKLNPTPEMATIIANARADYRKRSEYTEKYFNERESYVLKDSDIDSKFLRQYSWKKQMPTNFGHFYPSTYKQPKRFIQWLKRMLRRN